MSYAIEYLPGMLVDGVSSSPQWRRLNRVAGVNYEDIGDVLSLIWDLECCESMRGQYRVVPAEVQRSW